MAIHEIFMPALSSTMSEGKIVSWLKQPGDEVKKGEAVLVVESDKADMDVECFHSGTLATVLLPAGSSAPVGETLALVADTAADVEEAKTRSTEAASQPPAKTTPPAAPAFPAADAPATPTASAPAPVPAPAPEPAPAAGGRIIASPRAKALAKRLEVALESLQGSGPHGRIVANDVERAAGKPLSTSSPSHGSAQEGHPQAVPMATAPGDGPALTQPGAVAAAAPAPALAKAAPGQAAAFTTAQQAVNRNMTASLSAPCFQVGYTITTDPLEAFYRQVKPRGVTMTALLVKAVAVTLAAHPQLNSAYTPEGMRFGAGIHVAVAVAMEDGGLITPVLRDAERTDLYSLSRTWADLVKRARSKQLQPEDYSGGTFTLSNLGMFGVDRFAAILPPDTGAILAVAASRPVVAVAGGNAMAIQRQMQVNLTTDHRVIYGTHAAAFLKDLAKLLETRPESLAL
ncbi:dihydrolipoamide acetyltransferase family protein [Candidatus Synechococcus spongiarum]|uniref:Dihydrolipoamide acetyltransferase component of pyruvate dehydrogenase complex n=1 Tax=Candidatus Synechococcus spongiarum TaxID=431041 RepID=A0A164YWI4_9SYNE|nr:dihydrolipoamide acetyltransferase family protein [Candidatus Synechococcus spongiarum]SAY38694.1 Dihydrolipoamide acetyltransferase component of pyruvate dehydrogenase complex (EC 2.3.1.12) [Candidatus Synechococcus spongiarum]